MSRDETTGMSHDETHRILIAGAGIAGLTAALAFAKCGFDVSVFEQASELVEIGAGLQLSPNATRILDRLGVLDDIRRVAVQPEAVVLKHARDGSEIARVPVGEAALKRWGSPYLVCHRADLQRALLDAACANPLIEITTGARVSDFDLAPPRLTIEHGGETRTIAGRLVIAADGVWSSIRAHGGQKSRSRFIGQVAWRRTLGEGDPLRQSIPDQTIVSAFLSSGFHLITYPMRGGTETNLVAFTKYRRELPAQWNAKLDIAPLRAALARNAPALASLADDAESWTAYPIHVADLDGAWSDPSGLALIGDAAHAMTPFAAQGAAMAIEDAWTLAAAVGEPSVDMSIAKQPEQTGGNQSGHGADHQPDHLGAALTKWTIARRRRVLRVARRGALNEFAWHAGGPIAIVRNLFLNWRGSDRLAADLDWLYGWDADSAG